jgi:hypothetical protein
MRGRIVSRVVLHLDNASRERLQRGANASLVTRQRMEGANPETLLRQAIADRVIKLRKEEPLRVEVKNANLAGLQAEENANRVILPVGEIAALEVLLRQSANPAGIPPAAKRVIRTPIKTRIETQTRIQTRRKKRKKRKKRRRVLMLNRGALPKVKV